MAPTLRTVVHRAPLGLSVLTGRDALDRPVRWVAVSELEDPTPFLEGGELVLTTGMRLDAAGAGPYVGRLVARGVSGLGFGVGLGHGEIPAELLAAADRAGLPLLEVPRETPFVAIGKAVSDLLAAEQYEEITRAFAAQGRLTRAALRPEGARAVVDRLARELGGWAVLLDEAGAVRHAAGRGAAAVGGILPELGRLRGRAREGGSPASLAFSTPGEHVVVQPVGARRTGGFFAVGLGKPFTPVEHTVVNAAGSLLTLALEHGREHLAAERRVRAAALRLLLAGQVEAGRETLERLGDRFPDGPLVVLAAGGDREAALEAAGEEIAVADGDRVLVLVPAAGAEEAAAALAARAGACPLGVGAPVGPEELRTGIEQADRALASARGPAGPVVRFADLAGRGLLALLDAGAAAAFSSALLAPLREYGSRADLVESLRAYLACNGHWDAAAQRLGVHRHTLRYRMRRVAELLGRDLDDPAVRAELWVALSV
ncbi:PucR family transcriptional regulator [Planomonospora parontospora]|uniref:PucR family transcriptional regulator n=1 Tax=Planomonospora parontospora TaxID=58119 RepID=UPI00167035DB|nr:PucR family transcriptional regulator [Planomonospora parontospora]GGL21106.1 PucR family transcriptional regulator [Planomonospora parontospora subsp. antibiotica]GII15828.1 PucR family transcriptional regulator [Planomonospora parontospora subsp. antibiotica]